METSAEERLERLGELQKELNRGLLSAREFAAAVAPILKAIKEHKKTIDQLPVAFSFQNTEREKLGKKVDSHAADIDAVSKKLDKVRLTPGPRGEKGKDGIDGVDGLDGKDGSVANLKPLELRNLLESLDPEDRMDVRYLAGIVELIDERAIPILDKRTQFLINSLSQLRAYVNGLNPGGSTGAIIAATDSGDHQNYSLAKAATTTQYYAIINNGSYTTDDTAFGFSVSGTTLTFNSALPSDLAATIIKLVCV